MAYLSHGEAFEELWDLTRNWDRHTSDCRDLARFCIDKASVGESCEKFGTPEYAMVKFICAMQDDKYAPLMSQVADAYFANGLLKPNERIKMPREASDHYRKIHGKMPLPEAVRKGNVHFSESLVAHGADTSEPVFVPDPGGGGKLVDLFEFVQQHFGCEQIVKPSQEECAVAAARLTEIAMSLRMDAAAIAAPATPPVADSAVQKPVRPRPRAQI